MLKNLELKKNRFLYGLLLLSGIMISGLYFHYYGMVLLITIILLPFLSYMIPYFLLKITKIDIHSKMDNTIPNEPNTIHIYFALPILQKLEVEYFLSQPFSRIHEHEIIELKDWSMEVKLPHCGKVDYRLYRFKTYDLLHLFNLRRKIDLSYSYYIYPKVIPVDSYIENFHYRAYLEKGDDLTELYELRDYRQEDPMKSIHWKLSTKKGSLITKVGTKSDTAGVILFLKLTSDPSKNDTILSLFHSFALELIKEIGFTVAYLEEGEIKYEEVYHQDQYIELLQHILSIPIASSNQYELNGSQIYTFDEGGMHHDD